MNFESAREPPRTVAKKEKCHALAREREKMKLLQRVRRLRGQYLEEASSVRDTISISYQHGAASLLDFLNAQADYRSVQVNYLNLVAAYLNATSQMNLAVGREVIP